MVLLYYLFGYGAFSVVSGVEGFLIINPSGSANHGSSSAFRRKMIVGNGDDFAGIDSIGDDGDTESGRKLANEFLKEVRLRKEATASVMLPKVNEEKKKSDRKSSRRERKSRRDRKSSSDEKLITPSSSSAGLFSSRNTVVYSDPTQEDGGASAVASAGRSKKKRFPRLQPFTSSKTTPKLGLQAMIAASLLSSGYWVQCLIGAGFVFAYFAVAWAATSLSSYDSSSTFSSDHASRSSPTIVISSVKNGYPTLEK